MDQGGSQFFQGSSGRSPQRRAAIAIPRQQSAIKVREELRTGSIKDIFLSFRYRSFNESTLEQSINSLIYGSFLTLHYMDKNNILTFRQGVAYIIPESSQFLQFVDKRSYKRYAINLLEIVQLDDQDIYHHVQLRSQTPTQSSFLTVTAHVPQTNEFKSFYAEFSTISKRNMFQQAVQHQAIHEKYMMQFLNPINFMKSQLSFLKKDKTWLSPQEVQNLLHKLKYVFSVDNLTKVFFDDIQVDEKGIKLDELIVRFQNEMKRTTLRDWFAQLCGVQSIHDDFSGIMKIRDFKKFLHHEQKESVNDEDVENLVMRILIAGSEHQDQTTISFISFSEYLFSSYNLLIAPQEGYTSPSEMILPLTDYYINSAYSILGKPIDVKRFRILENYPNCDDITLQILYVLARGVRNIELEVWENERNEPVCAYGAMLSSFVPFPEIITTLKQYVFNSTSLPFFLHIEDHCTKRGKDLIAESINKTLGELLVPETFFDTIPSPKLLEGKIVLSGTTQIKTMKMKNQPQQKQKLETKSQDIQDEGVDSRQYHFQYLQASSEILASRRSRNFLLHTSNDYECKAASNKSPTNSVYSGGSEGSVSSLQLMKVSKTIQQGGLQLSGIQLQYSFFQIPLQQMIKMRDTRMIYETSDISHKKLLVLRRRRIESPQLNSEIQALEDQLRVESQVASTFLVKQYPTERVNCNRNQSSHMVVMQHQLIDFDYMYNYALFGGVDGVLRGFILKPKSNDFMQPQKSASTKRNSDLSLRTKEPKLLSLKIISGHFLLNENLQLSLDAQIFVQVIVRTPVFGHPENLQMQVTDKIVSKSQIHEFNSDFTFELPQQNAYFSVIMFVVYANDADTLVSWNSFKCSNLRQGYRVVPLLDENLNKISHSSIFVHLNIG